MHIDVIDQFRNFILESIGTAPVKIIADGRIHCFATNGRPKDKVDRYSLHLDSSPAGWWRNWRSDKEGAWHAQIERQLTRDEQAALEQRIASMRKQREAEEKKLHDEARQKAERLWNAAKD